MSGDATLLGAVLVYVLLLGVSVWFNTYIDSAPLPDRPDGLTALWVAVGTLYTLVGGAVLAWLLWPWLVGLESVVAAIVLLAINLSAFVASGLPMLLGDASRSFRVRRTQRAIEVARRTEFAEED